MEVSPIPFPDKTLTAGKGCQRSVLGPSSPTVVFTLPQRGSVITAPRGTRIALRVKAFAPAFPAAPLTTIARGRTAAVTWSPVPTRVHWTVEVTPVPAPAPVGSFVTVCPDDAGAGASTGT